jgi:hypothetical protein
MMEQGVLGRPPLGEIATDAIRYWERRRLAYNGVLFLTVVACFLTGMPGSRSHLDLNLLLVFFVLAVVANVLYSLAYVVDGFVQFSALREPWRRWRWVLFLIGTATAAIMARFFSINSFAHWQGP